MIAEGEVSVALSVADERVTAVKLQSTRPTMLSRVLEGKRVEEALGMVPLLFSLCGRAQAVAGVTAAEQALGLPADPATVALRGWLVVAEQVQETLWRLLVDLPAAVGEAAPVERVAAVRQRLAALFKQVQGAQRMQLPGTAPEPPDTAALEDTVEALTACFATDVFGRDTGGWSTAEAFGQWLERGETVVARALRCFDAQADHSSEGAGLLTAAAVNDEVCELAAQLLADPTFAAAPQWRAGHPETGALARRWHAPLIAALRAAGCDRRLLRQAARLDELAAALALLRTVPAPEQAEAWLGGGPLEMGSGYAWVETARGLLLHAVSIADGRIAAYRILAPTEWNFHPHGPLTRELAGWPAADFGELERQARLAVLALDPCVGFKVAIDYA